MKLFLHNLLTSRVLKAVKIGYPLKLKVEEIKMLEIDFQPEYIARLIPKVEWFALKAAVSQLGESYAFNLPSEVPQDYEQNQEFLKLAHKALLEIDIIKGSLICPETDREFP
ncbi:unnamed protein product, partial [Protopolystoma xenopodis]